MGMSQELDLGYC